MKQEPRGETLKGHIGPASFDGDGLARVVQRAVSQATSREQGQIIMDAVLAESERDSVPLSAGELTAFVLGPLFDSVHEHAGRAAADRVVSILKPMVKKKSELELGEAPDEDAPNPTVLIVDDDIVVRAQLLSILSSTGYNPISAPDPNVALAMSVRCRPDLIISDESMGRVKGSQLAALLKVAFHEAAPPIIILTDGEAHQDPEAGICMLRKPVERVALLEIIEPLLVRCSQPPS